MIPFTECPSDALGSGKCCGALRGPRREQLLQVSLSCCLLSGGQGWGSASQALSPCLLTREAICLPLPCFQWTFYRERGDPLPEPHVSPF